MYVDIKGIIDGLWRAGDADLWIQMWEELYLLRSKDILVEVEHFEAHRRKTDKKEMSRFEKFVTDGNEKADELAGDFCKGCMARWKRNLRPSALSRGRI